MSQPSEPSQSQPTPRLSPQQAHEGGAPDYATTPDHLTEAGIMELAALQSGSGHKRLD